MQLFLGCQPEGDQESAVAIGLGVALRVVMTRSRIVGRSKHCRECWPLLE
jgi:hypothetical protein